MKKITSTLLLGACLLLNNAQAQSDLFIDTSYTAEQMVMDFFNNSMITPSNVTFNGGQASLAFFEAADTDLGIPAGIFICTGDVHQAANGFDFFASTSNNVPGDSDLEALLGGQYASFDASVLEFDIQINTDTIDFTYVFGSEEYPEYVNSSFNDVFAFYINDAGSMNNIALVPDDQMPVAINNVHANLNAGYYVDNQGLMGQHIAYDGFTTPLPATYVATSGNSYHVKIAVTDMGDQVFDSGVFISIGSLGGSDTLQPPADAQVAINGNTVSVENLSSYATSWLWDFGDGYTSTERYPGPHTYATDGEYTITLTTQNFCCTDTYTTVVQIGEIVNNTTDLNAVPFELFPNPATDQLTIQAPLGEPLQYEITDVSGRSFKRGNCQGTETINLNGLTPGVYHLRLTGEAGTSVKRFLIED